MAKFKPGQLVITNERANDWYSITKRGAVCKILDISLSSLSLFRVEVITVLPNNDWNADALNSLTKGRMRSKVFDLHESTLDSFSFTILTSRRTNAN